MFQVIITNEVPVTILQAYISLPRHIQKGLLIRQIIASYLCPAVELLAISRRIEKTSNENYAWMLLFHFPLLSIVLSCTWCFQNIFWVNRNGDHKQSLGGHGFPWPPVATAKAPQSVENQNWPRLCIYNTCDCQTLKNTSWDTIPNINHYSFPPKNTLRSICQKHQNLTKFRFFEGLGHT